MPAQGTFVERNVLDPNGIVQVMKDYWWWCVEGDPRRALFFTSGCRSIGSPQCNAVQSVAQTVGERLGHDKTAKLIQIPIALAPWET